MSERKKKQKLGRPKIAYSMRVRSSQTQNPKEKGKEKEKIDTQTKASSKEPETNVDMKEINQQDDRFKNYPDFDEPLQFDSIDDSKDDSKDDTDSSDSDTSEKLNSNAEQSKGVRDSPYSPFRNYTEAMIFFLHSAFGGSRNFFNALKEIIQDESFNSNDFPSYDQIVASRKKLDLLPVIKKEVIDGNVIKNLQIFDPKVFLQRISCLEEMNIPHITPTETEMLDHFSHSEMVKGSPLFNSLDPFESNGIMFHIGDYVSYNSIENEEHFGRIIACYLSQEEIKVDIEKIKKGKEANELVSLNEKMTISNQKLIKKIIVHPSQTDEDYWMVSFIEKKQIKPLTERELPFCDIQTMYSPEIQSEKTLKVAIEFYSDDFNALNKNYHGVNGMYFTVLNHNQLIRSKPLNNFVFSFIPPNIEFQDAFKFIAEFFQDLEKGFNMMIRKSNEMEVMLVTGGLAMATGDLPQGQLYAGIQSHKAHIGSRVCYVHQTEFLDLSKDCSHRLLQTENEKLQNLRNLQPKDQEEFTKLNGLTPDVNWMENLKFDRFRQAVYDPFHSESGITKAAFESLISILLPSFISQLSCYISSMSLPSGWKRPPPLSKLRDFSITQTFQLCTLIITPLRCFLKKDSFRPQLYSKLLEETKKKSDEVIKLIIDAFNTLAQSNYYSLNNCLSIEERKLSEDLVILARRKIIFLFRENFIIRPNVHIAKHFPDDNLISTIPKLRSVAPKETLHSINRKVMKFSNFKNIERDMTTNYNIRFSSRFLLENGTKYFPDLIQPGPMLLKLLASPNFYYIWKAFGINEKLLKIPHRGELIDLQDCYVRLLKSSTPTKIYPTNNFYSPLKDHIISLYSFVSSYNVVNIKCYKKMYTCKKDNLEKLLEVKINDFIEIKLEDGREKNVARILNIFEFQNYVFLQVQWFQEQSGKDKLTLRTIYSPAKKMYNTFFDIRCIQKVLRLEHLCGSKCIEKCIEDSQNFLLNDYV